MFYVLLFLFFFFFFSVFCLCVEGYADHGLADQVLMLIIVTYKHTCSTFFIFEIFLIWYFFIVLFLPVACDLYLWLVTFNCACCLSPVTCILDPPKWKFDRSFRESKLRHYVPNIYMPTHTPRHGVLWTNPHIVYHSKNTKPMTPAPLRTITSVLASV